MNSFVVGLIIWNLGRIAGDELSLGTNCRPTSLVVSKHRKGAFRARKTLSKFG